MIHFVAWFIVAYIVGSIGFSIILFKLLGKDDPRKRFSGNPGTTNVYRQAGFFVAALVLLLDLASAMAVAFLSARALPSDYVPWISLALIFGNRFPCFHRFRGGKGVANYLGFTLVLAPVAAFVSMPAWLIVFRFSKLPFVASLMMVMVLSSGILIHYGYSLLGGIGVSLTTVFIICNHIPNIRDYIRGGGL